jgi:hypothetical protein
VSGAYITVFVKAAVLPCPCVSGAEREKLRLDARFPPRLAFQLPFAAAEVTIEHKAASYSCGPEVGDKRVESALDRL